MKLFTQIRWLQLFFVLALWVPLPTWSESLTDGLYDQEFARRWARYMPDYDFRWGVAQCYQESLLDPRAVSRVGARGLCQFMPKTFAECQKVFRIPRASPYDPEVSILCNAWYMQKMVRIWKSERPQLDRLYLGFASYNAGAGNIIKAQKQCNLALLWPEILPCLPQVTGKNAEETVTYVSRIKRWFKELIDGLKDITGGTNDGEIPEVLLGMEVVCCYCYSKSLDGLLRGYEVGEGSECRCPGSSDRSIASTSE